MIRSSNWPKQVKALRDNYLAAFLGLAAAIFFTPAAFSQPLQTITARPGYSWVGGEFRETFRLPKDTSFLDCNDTARIALRVDGIWISYKDQVSGCAKWKKYASATWGNISGTLSTQADLIAELATYTKVSRFLDSIAALRATLNNVDTLFFSKRNDSIFYKYGVNGPAAFAFKDSIGAGGSSELPSFYDGLDTAQIRWVNNRNLFWEFPNAANTKQTYIGADSSNLNLVPNDTMNIGITSKASVVRFRNMSPSGDSVLYLDANRILRNKLLALSTLSDVDVTTTPPSNNDYLKFNGTKWVNEAPTTIYPIRVGDSIKLTNGIDTTSGAFVRSTITLSGDVTGSGNATISTTLSNSGVTAGTYGSATQVPQFTVDTKGRITGVTNVTISGVGGGFSLSDTTKIDTVYVKRGGNSLGKALEIGTNDGSSGNDYPLVFKTGGVERARFYDVTGSSGPFYLFGTTAQPNPDGNGQTSVMSVEGGAQFTGRIYTGTYVAIGTTGSSGAMISQTDNTRTGMYPTSAGMILRGDISTADNPFTFTGTTTNTRTWGSGTSNYIFDLSYNGSNSSTTSVADNIRVSPNINMTGTLGIDTMNLQAFRPTLTDLEAGGKTTVVNAIRVYNGNTVVRNLSLATAGDKLSIATGSNASIGTATLVGGTVTVNTTAVTANSRIFVTVSSPGGTQGFLSIGTITAGTSFVINSTSATETSVVNWWIVN